METRYAMVSAISGFNEMYKSTALFYLKLILITDLKTEV